MANKKITDLQLRSAVTDDLNIPSDDGIQSYRVTGQQFKDYILPLNAIATDRIQDGAVTLAKLAAAVQELLMPTGAVLPYTGTAAPTGFLLCQGQAVSRSTYSSLFNVIGTAYGSGDGSTTFNVPDLRGMFLRGVMPTLTANGSGSASGNNATFTAHGYNRTGMKVRMTAGALTGLATNTDYYVIVVGANTLAFATTLANAQSGTKITISGTNTAVINQYIDPSARAALAPGGNTSGVGSFQEDSTQGHKHSIGQEGGSTPTGVPANSVSFFGGNTVSATNTAAMNATPIADGVNGTPRTSPETRPQNVNVNYMIKT